MSRRPIIALTGGREEHEKDGVVGGIYFQAVEEVEGEPLFIDYEDEELSPEAVLAEADGVLLAGGRDLDPLLYGESSHPSVKPVPPRRQEFDLELVRLARQRGVPVLGICLGLQEMNVALGGDLVVDLPPGPVEHRRRPDTGARSRHVVRIRPGTLLREVIARESIEVNSSHHQAVGRLAGGLRPAALAGDGVIEALEAVETGGGDPSFFLGVQWHPEELMDREEHRALFLAFVRATHRFRESR